MMKFIKKWWSFSKKWVKFWWSFDEVLTKFLLSLPKINAAATNKTTSKHWLTWVPKRWSCELPTNTHPDGQFLGFVGWTRTSIPTINWRPRKHDAFKCPCASVKKYWYTCTYTRTRVLELLMILLSGRDDWVFVAIIVSKFWRLWIKGTWSETTAT